MDDNFTEYIKFFTNFILLTKNKLEDGVLKKKNENDNNMLVFNVGKIPGYLYATKGKIYFVSQDFYFNELYIRNFHVPTDEYMMLSEVFWNTTNSHIEVWHPIFLDNVLVEERSLIKSLCLFKKKWLDNIRFSPSDSFRIVIANYENFYLHKLNKSLNDVLIVRNDYNIEKYHKMIVFRWSKNPTLDHCICKLDYIVEKDNEKMILMGRLRNKWKYIPGVSTEKILVTDDVKNMVKKTLGGLFVRVKYSPSSDLWNVISQEKDAITSDDLFYIINYKNQLMNDVSLSDIKLYLQ